ncbi:hypothetical protein [Mucilaginibacter sp. R-33]|uniref:hypothetical protein n=1 Tax=Mucilaginibacter sp. R-33 TaxID=3416711 RepID=UPI003CEB6842
MLDVWDSGEVARSLVMSNTLHDNVNDLDWLDDAFTVDYSVATARFLGDPALHPKKARPRFAGASLFYAHRQNTGSCFLFKQSISSVYL